ncbi:BGTF surface domain-containing protein [Salinarchaeum laminariae]|uniref:BGTF surface domain-containing protein n=1 Tax=Salinarchaeum laminariae TaxID=869888 RepID=UPI0020BF3857|nr:BGTF surface domain-containing protein [Salinarchaeum laminariae]
MSDGTNASTFTLRQQTINTFEFDTDSIVTGSTHLTIDSNRANYNVTVSADGLDGDDLESIFNTSANRNSGHWVNDSAHTGEDSVVLAGEGDVDADFTGIDAGNYTFDMEVVDTGVTASTNISVNEGATDSATFGSNSYSGVVGDVVEVDMTTDGEPSDVYVNVTDDEGYYTATVHIEPNADAYDEGFTLSWNTYNASESNDSYGFSVDNGNVAFVNNTEGAAIDADYLANTASLYEFESYTDDPEDSETDFSDITSVSLSERSTDGLTIWTAPSSFDHTDDSSEILDAATQSSTIAQQDLLITQVEATGLYGYMNTTAEGLSSTGGLDLTFTQETTAGPYDSDDSDTIAGIGGGNATIVPDGQNGTFYVLIDAAEIDGLETGEEWSAEFSVSTDNPFVSGENETVSSNFTYEERNVEITGEMNDNDRLVVPGTSDATITGETNVAPGTAVNVRMNFAFDFATASGEVADDGTFAVATDLSDREAGTQFDTRVRVPGSSTQATQASIISDASGSTGASFSVDASANGPVTVGDSATLEYTISNDGDAAGTTNYTVMVNGEQVANGTAELGAGNSTETMTYEDFDTSSAGDISWEVTTDDDTASGTLTVEEEEPSDDSSGDDSSGDDSSGDDSSGDDSSGDDGDSDDGGDGGQAGFGLIVALFALIGAALLALRRQN